MRAIDLNADLGEGFPLDEALLERVSSANVCCGAHAGDPQSIRDTLHTAKQRGVVVGAHPGYPDRVNFGRKPREISSHDVRALILEQVDKLAALAEPIGVSIRYLKPHGALYNQAQSDSAIATGVVEAAHACGMPVLGMPGSEVEMAARIRGVRFVAEGFVDRHYQNGRLASRGEAQAELEDPLEIVSQSLAFFHSRVLRDSSESEARGTSEPLPIVETLCIHGDRADADAVADLVRGALRLSGATIRSFIE